MEIIGVIVAGIIIGLLGKFVAPSSRDNIPLWLTILCGVGGVIIGWYIYTAFGGNDRLHIALLAAANVRAPGAGSASGTTTGGGRPVVAERRPISVRSTLHHGDSVRRAMSTI